MIADAKRALGARLVILGHHYQRDDVMEFADARGDSFALSRYAARQKDASYVVFCGVHFMAESADILTGPDQVVILPDLGAGCSMADMADTDDVEEIFEELARLVDIERVVPITYMNSAATLKAFVGDRGGTVCTSSNAGAVLRWALGLDGGAKRGDQVLFFPDQHLGRNTGYQLGFGADDMVVVDPRRGIAALEPSTVKSAPLLLWKGHCSVHQRFQPAQIERFRAEHPDGLVIVHPECSHEVVEVADLIGSTDYIIKAVADAPSGTPIAIGTEIHLVHRLATEHPDREIVSLDPVVCPCATMSRIDPAHLAWVLEGLLDGEVRNQISVAEPIAGSARVALERMLSIT
jgi:quinolinate synthase